MIKKVDNTSLNLNKKLKGKRTENKTQAKDEKTNSKKLKLALGGLAIAGLAIVAIHTGVTSKKKAATSDKIRELMDGLGY